MKSDSNQGSNLFDNYAPDTFRAKNAKDILATMRDYILTHTNEVNDFTAGSALETLLEATATELEMYYDLGISNIQSGIDEGIYSAFGFMRIKEQKAYGDVTIDFGNPLASQVNIPRGTRFNSLYSNYYRQEYVTLDDYVVPAGTQIFSVTVYCTTGGKDGNIPAGMINNVTNLPGITNVVNNASISTGTDEEPLVETRKRFRSLIQALQRGTVEALQYGAKEVPGITSAFVDEEVGYVRVFCHDANGDLGDRLRQQVQANMINWRPAGIPVEVFPVHKSIVDINVTLDVPNVTLRDEDLTVKIMNELTNWINTFVDGEGIVHSQVIDKIMNTDPLAIKNARADIMVTPDDALRQGLTVINDDAIIINEHKIDPKLLQPVDRTQAEGYIHNPWDYDDRNLINSEQTNSKQNLFKNLLLNANIKTDISPITVTRDSNNNIVLVVESGVDTHRISFDDHTEKVINYLLRNNDTQQINLSITSPNVMEVELTNSSGKSETHEINKNTTSVVGKYSIIFTDDEIKVTDTDTKKINTINRSLLFLESYLNPTNYFNFDFSKVAKVNQIDFDAEASIFRTLTVFGNLTTENNYNVSGNLIDSSETVTNVDATKVITLRDADGNILRITKLDRQGNIVSQTDGSGTPITPTPTPKPDPTPKPIPDNGGDTPNDKPNKNKYPFADSPVVTAKDAQEGSYAPVFNAYKSQGDEILRAGKIIVKIKND